MVTLSNAKLVKDSVSVRGRFSDVSRTDVLIEEESNKGALRAHSQGLSTTGADNALSNSAVVKKGIGRDRDVEMNYPLEEGKRELDGSVLDIDGNVSVVCEIFTNNGPKNIRLPMSLFPDSPHYGMMITIGIDESGSVRRPFVRERAPNPERLASGVDQMRTLIDTF